MPEADYQSYQTQELGKPIYAVPRTSLILLLAILAAMVVIYFVLQSYDQKYLTQLASAQQEIKTRTQFFQQNFSQAQAIQLYSQALNLKTLFDNHVFLSKFFKTLEQYTHPRVYFLNLNIEATSGRVSLPGQADSPRSLAEQIVIFKKSNIFNSISVGSFAESPDGSVSFSLTGIINKSIYTQQ